MPDPQTTKTAPSFEQLANLSHALWQDAEREIERLKKELKLIIWITERNTPEGQSPPCWVHRAKEVLNA